MALTLSSLGEDRGGYNKVHEIACVLEVQPAVTCESSLTGMHPGKQSASGTPADFDVCSV